MSRKQRRLSVPAGDQFAAAIGFFGFLSIVALLVVGIALVGDVERVLPGAGEALARNLGLAEAVDTVADNRVVAGLTGLVLLVVFSLRVVGAASDLTREVLVPEARRGAATGARLRQLATLVVAGGPLLFGVAAVAAVGPLPFVVATAAAFGFDVAGYLLAYRLLSGPTGPRSRRLLTAGLMAAAGWVVLKVVAVTWVWDRLARASEFYAAIGSVVALLVLLYLAGRLYVAGAALVAAQAPADPDARSEPSPPTVAAPATQPLAALGPADPSPSISDATRERLATRPGPAPAAPRHALAFVLAIGAVAGFVGAARPWEVES